MAKLERELARAGLETELYEVWSGGGDGGRKTATLPQEYLYNSLGRYLETARQVNRETDREAEE